MSERRVALDPAVIEPERYELDERLPYHFAFGRRGFLQAFSGLVVLVVVPRGEAQESGRGGRAEGQANELAAWLRIGEDGSVEAFTGKVEVGQNARTSLSQAVADELHVRLGSVRLVMGDTDLTPFDMGTFGSRSTPVMAPQLRRAAAAAREMLKELAAKEWSVEPAALEVESGAVVDPKTKRTLGFGALTRGQKLVRTLKGDSPTLPPAHWTVAGRSAAKVHARDIVTGRHRYPSDLGPAPFAPAELLHGKVLRPPAIGATLDGVEQTSIDSLAGAVVVTDGDFVGIAARSSAEAARALASLRPKWTLLTAAGRPRALREAAPGSRGAGHRGRERTRRQAARGRLGRRSAA